MPTIASARMSSSNTSVDLFSASVSRPLCLGKSVAENVDNRTRVRSISPILHTLSFAEYLQGITINHRIMLWNGATIFGLSHGFLGFEILPQDGCHIGLVVGQRRPDREGK